MKQLLVNAIITPDGTRLESLHRHDYKSYVDANGETYSVDGGLEYVRRSVNKEAAQDASVYSSDSHATIREVFKWGTYGKSGKEKFHRKTLASLDDEHIEAILATQKQLNETIRKVFRDEIDYRKTANENYKTAGEDNQEG
jgi:hypothetical protein